MERGLGLGFADRPLVELYDAGLFDLDGVLYLGASPVEHAAASVRAALAAGMRPAYVTNNASRRPEVVAEHLRRLGIPAEVADVVTSAQAAGRWLAEHLAPGDKVLVLGTEDLASTVRDVGLVPVRTADEDPSAVVQGFSDKTAWADLAEAMVALRAGALWVAGNTDSTFPSVRGPLPGNGAMVAALTTATGLSPVVVGKPEPALHRESVLRVGAERPLVIGDRLDTDVLGAVRGGADSLLVLTGVVDVPKLLSAGRGTRPTYVASDLRGLLRVQLPVEVAGDLATCGSARVRWQDGHPVTVEDGDEDEALRAACALAWDKADEA